MTGPGMPYVGRGNGGSVVDDGIVGRRSSDADMMTNTRQFVKISIVFFEKNVSFQCRFRQSWSRRTLSETERDRELVCEGNVAFDPIRRSSHCSRCTHVIAANEIR